MDTGTTEHINLAISGAGTCGAAEAGAACALLDAGYVVDNVAGVSAGAMLGAVVAARMSTEQIRATTTSINYPSFQQPANRVVSFLVKVPVVGRWIAWNFLGGAYKLDALRSTVDEMLAPMGSRTWGEHQARVARGEAANFCAVTYNLNEGEQMTFPAAYEEEMGLAAADRPISESIATSVAMPTFFVPPRIRDVQGRDWVFTDGGTVGDFPYDIAQQMDPSKRTVAITIDQPRPFSAIPRWGWFHGPQLLLRLLGMAGSAAEQRALEDPSIAANTIVCPTIGFDGNNFDLSPQGAQQLFDAGYKAGQAWIAKDLAARRAPSQSRPAPDAGLAA